MHKELAKKPKATMMAMTMTQRSATPRTGGRGGIGFADYRAWIRRGGNAGPSLRIRMTVAGLRVPNQGLESNGDFGDPRLETPATIRAAARGKCLPRNVEP